VYTIVKCSTLEISFLSLSLYALLNILAVFYIVVIERQHYILNVNSITAHLCFKVLILVLFLELSSVSCRFTLQFADSKLSISYCRVLHFLCFALFITPLLLLPFQLIICSCLHIPVFVLFAVSDVSLF